MGGFIGLNSLQRRRRRRIALASNLKLKAADELRRELVLALLNQTLIEAGQVGEVVTIISHNEARKKLWRYGEFISPESIIRSLNVGTQEVLCQGNWRDLSPFKKGFFTPRKEFEPGQEGWVFLIGIQITPPGEATFYVSFNEPT